MKKLTQEQIKKLATDIYEWCKKHDCDDALCIYYGHERINTYSGKMIIEQDCEAKDYCEYAPWHNIITISSEGILYDWYDMEYEMPTDLRKLWTDLGLYCECNESWNWSLYPAHEMEIEYPDREEEIIPITLYKGCGVNYPKILDTVMDTWYFLSDKHGDDGSCVIGSYLQFEFEGVRYHMLPCSKYQGEGSWLSGLGAIRKMLEEFGATNIIWHNGRLD